MPFWGCQPVLALYAKEIHAETAHYLHSALVLDAPLRFATSLGERRVSICHNNLAGSALARKDSASALRCGRLSNS
jgi:hypothetical protein